MTRTGVTRAPAVALALAVLLGGTGCFKQSVAPREPPAATSPVVDAVYPPARATLVPYDTEVWVRFREPLDLSTVNTSNLFFKLDTRRTPITLEWDAATNRLRIVPQVALELRRTYTIEITSRVRTASGRIVGDPWFWQFTTNSLRRIESSLPANGATWESPFAMLAWDSTEVSAGSVRYTVWTGADSAAIAAHPAFPLAFPGRGFWIPRVRWAAGQRLFWTVRATNAETGEVADGPVWHFDVLPASTPMDTVNLPLADWGSYYGYSRGGVFCRSTLYAGPLMNNAFYWNLSAQGPGLRLAGQDVVIGLTYSENPSQYSSRICPVKTSFQPCSITQTLPEAEALEVANGVRIPNTTEYRFASDYFAAHVEATARYGRVWGYTLRANNLSYHSVGGTTLERGVLRLFRYRVPPGALVADRAPVFLGAPGASGPAGWRGALAGRRAAPETRIPLP